MFANRISSSTSCSICLPETSPPSSARGLLRHRFQSCNTSLKIHPRRATLDPAQHQMLDRIEADHATIQCRSAMPPLRRAHRQSITLTHAISEPALSQGVAAPCLIATCAATQLKNCGAPLT